MIILCMLFPVSDSFIRFIPSYDAASKRGRADDEDDEDDDDEDEEDDDDDVPASKRSKKH